jgi:cbb3-type cytochrome oxidase subunit 3
LDGKIVNNGAITSFDSGHRVLPVFRVKVNDKAYATDTIGIDVGYAAFDPNEDYRPIKEIEEVQVPPRDYRLWFAAAVTLLLLAGIAYMLIKRKSKRVAESAESKLSPFEEAMKELEALRKQVRTNNGEVKAYYTKLNDIVRRFLMRRWQITSLQQTNDELVKQLEKFNLPRKILTIRQALNSRFVKFAKYLP